MIQLIITVRKEVETYDQAVVAYEIAKTKLESIPNIKVNGSISNHFDAFDTIPDEPE